MIIFWGMRQGGAAASGIQTRYKKTGTLSGARAINYD
jgi:hypothetical protein